MFDGPEQVDVLENGTGPRWWEAVPRQVRRIGAALVVVALIVAAVVWVRDRAADRALAQRIDLVASLGVWTSSSSPAGGRVSYFLAVRNEGPREVSVTAVGGGGNGVLLRMRGPEWAVPPGGGVSIPLSVRLTCAAHEDVDTGSGSLTAEMGLRRADGGTTSREIDLEPSVLLLSVATLCGLRPDVSDLELSGPVLRPTAGKIRVGG